MKIACLQFAPELGKVHDNIRRANEILQRTNIPARLDWLVLPELAFTGYKFLSLEQIRPFLEPTTSGPSTQWAIQIATTYKCHVTVGYPELTTTEPKTQYNSAVTVSPTGIVLNNYRKSFLYYTDETWAAEGPSRFFSGQLGALGQVTLGICMDINPYKFIAPWEKYEFATQAVESMSPVVCVSMAWLSLLTSEEIQANPKEPDVATMSYWVERFQPLIQKAKTPVILILANRCGIERDVCYAGSSTVMKIDETGVALFDKLGKFEEKCLVVDTTAKPIFQVTAGQG